MGKIILVIIVILAVGGGIFYVVKNKSPLYGNPSSNSQTSTTNTTTSTEALNKISIKNFAFNPGTLTVPVGTTVTWTNEDSTNHQIKSATFNSAVLSNGATFSFKFDQAGSFDYSCAIHPSMTGKIIVQ